MPLSRHGARTPNSSRETSLQRISRGLDTRALHARTIFFRAGPHHGRRQKRTADPIGSAVLFWSGLRGSEPLRAPIVLWFSRPNTAHANPIALSAIGGVLTINSTREQKRERLKPFSFLFWSGLRGSNPPPSPWQGDALPNELNPQTGGASGRNRTNDTGIFSPLLYQLSYRGVCN